VQCVIKEVISAIIGRLYFTFMKVIETRLTFVYINTLKTGYLFHLQFDSPNYLNNYEPIG